MRFDNCFLYLSWKHLNFRFEFCNPFLVSSKKFCKSSKKIYSCYIKTFLLYHVKNYFIHFINICTKLVHPSKFNEKIFLEFCDPFFVSSEKESKISNKDLIHFRNILNQISSRFKMQELNIRVSVLTKMPCNQFFHKKQTILII